MARSYPSIKKRISNAIVKNAETGCWESKAKTQGYGSIDYEGKTQPIHRVVWKVFKGEIPEGLFVLHKCDNRRCCRISRLYLGTKKQNRADFLKRHPNSREILLKAAMTGAIGVKSFWDKMTPRQRKAFCKRRSKIQAEKKAKRNER